MTTDSVDYDYLAWLDKVESGYLTTQRERDDQKSASLKRHYTAVLGDLVRSVEVRFNISQHTVHLILKPGLRFSMGQADHISGWVECGAYPPKEIVKLVFFCYCKECREGMVSAALHGKTPSYQSSWAAQIGR